MLPVSHFSDCFGAFPVLASAANKEMEMLDRLKVSDAVDAGRGVLRLEPCWVPRAFLVPGRRLRLHPDDLYAFGGHRGGIDERWFSSTIKASNGPLTTEDEGLSYVRVNGKRFLLADADRKSTRLNSSHRCISYAVFCLKKKNKNKSKQRR